MSKIGKCQLDETMEVCEGCGACGEAENARIQAMHEEEQDRREEEWDAFCNRTPTPIDLQAMREVEENEH